MEFTSSEQKSYIAFRNMFRRVDEWYTGDDEDPYALVIVVKDRLDGNDDVRPFEEDAVQAALSAFISLIASYETSDEIQERMDAWISTRIRKIVKRAHGSKWRKVLAYTEQENSVPSAHTVSGGSEAVCFAPMKISEQPKPVKSLQVSGLELPISERKDNTSPNTLGVVVDENLKMSSGKVIAQSGHAVQLAFKYLDDDAFGMWMSGGFSISVARGKIDPKHAQFAVRDAGFTEVAPGSMTVIAALGSQDE